MKLEVGEVLELLLEVVLPLFEQFLLLLGHSPLEAALAAFCTELDDVDYAMSVLTALRTRRPWRFEQRKVISNLVLSVVDAAALVPDGIGELVVFLVAKRRCHRR